MFTTPVKPGPSSSSFVAQNHKFLIDGAWADGLSADSIEVFDPSTGAKINQVQSAGPVDVDAAVAAARKAFEAGPWPKMKPDERAKLLWRLADLIESEQQSIAEIEVMDNGKPIRDALAADLPSAIDCLRYTSGWCTKINGEAIPMSLPGSWHAYTVREPVGVVAAIVPWNFPFLIAVQKLAPALATGCTVILKPAEQTPFSALRLGQLVMDAGFPAGVVNVLTGGPETGAALVSHPGVDKVSFTGSTEVGRDIVRASAGNLKRVSLELGGKSPVVVFPDADLDKAIPGIAHGIFFNTGQCCVAGTRLFLHASVFDRTVEGLADQATRLRIGPGLDPETQLGPLVSDMQLNRVNSFIEQSRRDGASVVTGGARHGNQGYFIMPTILAGTTREMSVVNEEVFGPVICAMRYEDDDLDKIAKEANSTTYGLAASIWTSNVSTGHRLASKIDAGSIWINNDVAGDPALPFGGFKQSGWGRESGFGSIELHTELKTIVVKLA
jgi:phenylacetaldehyde dehydrogenase